MKKSILAILLALMMVLTLAACGGGDQAASSAPASSSAPAAPAADEQEEEPEEEAPAAEDDLSGWSCYAGGMDDGSTVYYAYHPDGNRAAFINMSPDQTMSVSIIGNYEYNEAEAIGYITDDATGITIADRSFDNGDGTLTVDLGDLGSALIQEVDPAELLAAMDLIQAGTTDITAEFAAAVGGGSSGGSEGTTASGVDVSGWDCYAGADASDGTTYYFAFNPEGTRGGIMNLSADETESVFLFGDFSADASTSMAYLTDDNSGATLQFMVIDNGDGTFTIDFGNLGSAVVTPIDSADLLTTMDYIQANTTDLTAEFLASFGL